ncbi:cAMP-dependent protein kinase catalytic subunit 1-like [Diorhabda carinulata]|uniref:cAMP-dependent protein kinase catalytic subunit 1-like n=1 Tax=Diorhabda carinulata TaxID=1163345 RepID=UPI0025A268F6|nr:cAMP-dependent protein kinase catalytic subunit 1-like [Diorhabda carinulata]
MTDEKLQKHYLTFETYLRRSKKEFEGRIEGEMKITAQLEDFKLMKVLGTGSFGKVMLCKYKEDDNMYAMKIMEKVNIVRTKQVAHTISEIRFLDAFKFPFIVSLQHFFKNNVYVFLVMPFINGGEMFYHLRSLKKFEEHLAKFYTAQVILSFEYMHYLGIVYRDLKPENILIDSSGYLKITDLGFCKKIDSQRTYTLCGTPEYLAPEIILSQGYNYSVDWWSLGILIYEMCAGFPPFFAKDHMKLYEKIVSGKFSCPPHFSRAAKDLVTNILQVDRSKRFGVMKSGTKDIKGHDWFKGLDFDIVFAKKYKPTFIPVVQGQGDTKFFEPYGDMDLREASFNEYDEEFKSMSLK